MITSEQLSQAISTMIDGKLKDINFDRTEAYIINDITNRERGEYRISAGVSAVLAYSDRTDYEVGDLVYVLTPENDTDNPRFIIGRKEEVGNSYKVIDPFEHFVQVEKISILESQEVISIIANSEETEKEITQLDNLHITGYDTFGLTVSFKTTLGAKVISGNYGIKAILYYYDFNNEDIKIEKELDSSYILGNPYSLQDFTTQKITFSIKNNISSIHGVELILYQKNNFVTKSGDDFEGKVQSLVVEEDRNENNIQIKNLTLSFGYDVSNIATDYIQICCEELTKYKDENDTKSLQLRWIHFDEQGNKIYLDKNIYGNTNDENLRVFLNECDIKWYKYNVEAKNTDGYGGPAWDLISTANKLTFNYDFIPSLKNQQENIKVVIVKNSEIFLSDTITFVNEIKVMDQDILDFINGFNLQFMDKSLGNYYVYDQMNQLIDYSYGAQVREIKCFMNNEIIIEAKKIEWKIPKENTMIQFLATENQENYNIDFNDNNYYILTAKNEISEDGFSFKYKIKPSLKDKNYNNTIVCSYWKNSTNTYTTSSELRFGVQGTNGTDVTLVLEKVAGSIFTKKKNKLIIQANLYNTQGEINTSDDYIYTFSFYNPYNPTRESSLNLISKGNICEVEFKGDSKIDDINILQCKVEGYGKYNLIAYYPIGISNDTLESYVIGPTQIICDASGKANYNNIPFELYNNNNEKINCDWKIIVEDENKREQFENFIPKIIGNELYTNNFFIQNCPLVAAQAYVDDKVLYTQPILMIMNSWFSSVINEWNGRTLGINEEEGYILSKMLSAGKKNEDNKFSGVLLGDWSGAVARDLISKNTGLYGFHEGNMSFYFKDDGTAAIGKRGVGQIQFDGNSGTIQSGLYQHSSGESGAFIDLTTGKIILANKDYGKVVLNASSQNIFKTNAEGSLIDENKNILYTDDNGESYYYIKKDGTKVSSEPVRINGYPIIISEDGTEENAKFKVAWDGTLHATNGRFSGHINATSGDINGNFNVYGTLKGAEIKSGRFIASYNGIVKESWSEVTEEDNYDKTKTYYDNKNGNVIEFLDANEFKKYEGDIWYKKIDFSDDDSSYPIVFQTNIDDPDTIVGGIGLVKGNAGTDDEGNKIETSGLGLISEKTGHPLIFDARDSTAKINSNKGIYFTLDKTADSGQAGYKGDLPYISMTEEDSTLTFGNFKNIKIGNTTLDNYIIALINKYAPKPSPEPDEEPEETKEDN